MIYIYDVLLNFCEQKVYDFFEWEKSDKLSHIKRIPMFKVEKNLVNRFLYNKIKISENLVSKIYNLTEEYTQRKVMKVPYAFIITDGISALALKSDKYGNISSRSKLIIDEEEEVVCLSSKLEKVNLVIEKETKILSENFLTRKEETVKSFLTSIIEKAYINKNYEKLRYLYSEYSNKYNDDISDVYKELLSSINKNLEPVHYDLYNLLQLTTNKN